MQEAPQRSSFSGGGLFTLTTGKLRPRRASWLPRYAEGCRFLRSHSYYRKCRSCQYYNTLHFIRWEKEPIPWLAEYDLALLELPGACDGACLLYLHLFFALSASSSANSRGALLAQMRGWLREWLVLAESSEFSWDKLLHHLGGTSNRDWISRMLPRCL